MTLKGKADRIQNHIGNFSREIGTIKRGPHEKLWEMKNRVMKSAYNGLINGPDTAEGRIHKQESKSIEDTQTENRDKNVREEKQSIRDLQDSIKWSNIHAIIGISGVGAVWEQGRRNNGQEFAKITDRYQTMYSRSSSSGMPNMI